MIVAILLTSTLLPSGDADSTAKLQEKALQLVQALGHSSFKVRENASAQLSQMGSAAVEALRDGVKNADQEVSERCRRLLPPALELLFQEQVEAFIAKPNDSAPSDLPGIKRWIEIAGKGKQSRELYASFARQHHKILLDVELEPDSANQRFQAFCREVYERMPVPATVEARKQIASESDVLTFLFLAADPKCRRLDAKGISSANPYATIFLDSNHLLGLLNGKETSATAQKLFLAWLENERYLPLLRRGYMVASEANIKEAAPLALKMAADVHSLPTVRAYPLLGIAKMLRPEHLKEIEPLLKDKTVIARLNLNSEMISVEIRDVALGLSILATDQAPGDYGFERYRGNQNLVSTSYINFALSDAKRDSAFAKWNEWVAKKKK